jgi:hypothetical protein
MRVPLRSLAASAVIAVLAAGILASSDAQAASHQPATAKAPVAEAGLFIAGGPKARASFAKETGVQPGIEVNYSNWGAGFLKSWATSVTAAKATPLIQVTLGTQASVVTAIARGKDDKYLIAYAKAVKAFKHPVILSYGREMNGTWYKWGWKHTNPSTFVAAWRHIVTVFRKEGATNVTWLWTVQAYADAPQNTANPAPWWPGSGYVTEVGIDGHYLYKGQKFATVFDQTLTSVRHITSKPILIAEVGIAQKLGQQALLPNLFAGVKSQKLLGFVYFDVTGNADYTLKTKAVLAAFGAAARKYGYAGAK